MDHYVDIEIKGNPEIAEHELMSMLFRKLHHALGVQDKLRIGVSFPGVDVEAPCMGSRLRMHGSSEDLRALCTAGWLGAMRDHVVVGDVASVPGSAKHRIVRRVQSQSSPARVRRRLMRRTGLSEQEALRRIPEESAEFLRLPYLHMSSSSTGQSFRLFVEHGPLLDKPETGDFSAYGLSRGATVPWF